MIPAKFDKPFNDVYKSAIEAAGLEAHPVDTVTKASMFLLMQSKTASAQTPYNDEETEFIRLLEKGWDWIEAKGQTA